MRGKKFGASMPGWVTIAGWTLTCRATPVVFLIQAATGVVAVWVITTRREGSTYERTVVVPSLLLIVAGVAAAG
jgi:hypothetical protein